MAFYNSGLKALLDGDVDYLVDTIKCAILDNTYTPSVDNDDFWSNVSGDEVSGTNYTAGGETLGGKTTTQDNTNDRAIFDANAISWTNVTFSAGRYAVFYKDTGTPATSQLLFYRDLGSDQNPSAADFTLTPNATGIFAIG